MEKELREIGLLDNEIKVYLDLLRRRQSRASDIAKTTKLHRVYVYDILNSLIEKGFVSYVIKNNVKYFNAVSPEKILQFLKEKEEKVKNQEDGIKGILPKLLSIQKITEKPVVEILEGKEGIKTALNDLLRAKKEWLAFGTSGLGPKVLPYDIPKFENQRQKAGITLKVICNDSPLGIKRGKEFSKMKHTYVRYMPARYSSPASTWIYEDTLAIIMWSLENPFAIRIRDKVTVKGYCNHFNVLWKIAKKSL